MEVSTRFEGLDFVIERLFRGSVLNYRTFFMEEGAAVQLRFGKASVMQELPYTTMQGILKRYPDFNQVFVKFRLAIVKRGKSMPLDYIMALPKQIMNRLTKQTKQKISEMKKDEI